MKNCKSVIQIIGGEDFTFKQVTFCFKCRVGIKQEDKRLTFGAIVGKTPYNAVAFDWADYCPKCAIAIKKTCEPEKRKDNA